MENSLGVVEAEFVAFTGRATVERMMVVTYLLFLTSKGEAFHDEIQSLMEQAQIPEAELAWYWALHLAMTGDYDIATDIGELFDTYADAITGILELRSSCYDKQVAHNGTTISEEYIECLDLDYDYYARSEYGLLDLVEMVTERNKYLISIVPHKNNPKFVAGRFISERLENAKRK